MRGQMRGGKVLGGSIAIYHVCMYYCCLLWFILYSPNHKFYAHVVISFVKICPCGNYVWKKAIFMPMWEYKSLCPCGRLKSTRLFFAPGSETQDTVVCLCLSDKVTHGSSAEWFLSSSLGLQPSARVRKKRPIGRQSLVSV